VKASLLYLALCSAAWAQISVPSGLAPAPSPPILLATVAALKSLAGDRLVDAGYVAVGGYYAINDGGGGMFYYNPASTAPDDGGSVIAPRSGSGRWLRIFNGPIDVRQFGARGDGMTDDTARIQAAINTAAAISPGLPGGEVFFPAGFTGVVTAPLSIPAGLSGFSLVGDAPQDDPERAQIQYRGSAARPIVVFTYSFVGHSGFQLAADATIAGAEGASARILPAAPSYLTSGAVEEGYLGSIHGTLSRTAESYVFTRDAPGLTTTLTGGLDCYVPDLRERGAGIKADRASLLRNISVTGNGNATGILFQGHGSGEYLENVRVRDVAVAVQITQPPSAGNDEFITFHRCNFSGYQCGLWVAGGDSYAITVESCSIGVEPALHPSVGRAAIRVLGPTGWSPGKSGAGLNVYGGNIGTRDATLANNIAALEVSGVGDPISFSGVRSECVGTAVRLFNGGGSGRSIHFQSCSFSMNPRSLLPFSSSTHFDRGIFFTSNGRTYRVVSAGISGRAGPTSTSKAPEANGSMTVAYVAATAAQDDYASYSYIVESGTYHSQDQAYAQSPGGHDTVSFDSTSFGLNRAATGGLAVDGAPYLSLRYDQCVFGGRLFEYTSSSQPMIVRNQCSFRPWPAPPQFTYDDNEAGASVNLLRENSDPTPRVWTIGAQATVANSRASAPDREPAILGGNGFRLGVSGGGKAYDTPATLICQDTGIAANLETGNDYYVLAGAVPAPADGRAGAIVLTVTDQRGFIMAKGIYSGGTRFALPFAAGDSRLLGHIRLWVGAMDLNNASVSAGVAMLQIGRNRDHTYVQTKEYPIDGQDGFRRDELFHGVVSAGRLILPSSQRGGMPSGPHDLRDGDIRLDANRRLSVFDGVVWEFHPRTFYQTGVVPPTTGIWRVGDQILDEKPASGSFIGLVCIAAGAFIQTGGFAPADYGPWAADAFVQLSSYRYTTAGNIYKCVREGTTSGSAPSASAGSVQDGSVWWEFVGRIGRPIFKTFGPISRADGNRRPDSIAINRAVRCRPISAGPAQTAA